MERGRKGVVWTVTQDRDINLEGFMMQNS